jgi:hypothetical protein
LQTEYGAGERSSPVTEKRKMTLGSGGVSWRASSGSK